MLIGKLLSTRKTDAQLPDEIRAALVASLFGSLPSLVVGAIACSIIGAAVATTAGDPWILACSAAIFAVGMVRVVSAIAYKRRKRNAEPGTTKRWEVVYEFGAWVFAGLLGLLCLLTVLRTTDPALHLIVSTTAAGYAAAIAGRNAGHPIIAVGQLALTALPLCIALFVHGGLPYQALGVVLLLFIYGMVDITLNIREIILQALTMTRSEAALAARYEEQANRFDIALNNMSHGLCMFDQQDRLKVWNARFVEILKLSNSPIRVGVTVGELVRHSIRAGNHSGKGVRRIVQELTRALKHESYGQIFLSLDGKRTLGLSRRLMADGGSVVILEDVTERKAAQERITHLAHFDELTGLANRTHFRERIMDLLDQIDVDRPFALHLIDLDRFKVINDTLGHSIGDKLLKEVSRRLCGIIRTSDMIARFGGDEFVVLQCAPTNRQAAGRLAQRLVKTLALPFEIDGHRIDIGASIGITLAPKHGNAADELLKKADMALYAAKGDGGGCHRFFASEMEEEAQARRALELDLREALAQDGFELFFQPLVNLRTGEITACEALLRWPHHERGYIPPSEFIPIAEETGLIIALGEWVLDRACHEAATWPNDVKVAVNMSPVQFRDRTLGRRVISALAKAGLPARRLEVEITERVLLEETDTTLLALEQLITSGVNISLDDFGTGFSSLNYLRKFPFQKIKIDRSFIHDLGRDREAQLIVQAVASLGASLDMVVVAEGVETSEQLKQVKTQGCHEGQGYLFGNPMPAAAIREQLATPKPCRRLIA